MATVSYPSISTESAHECKVSPHQVLPMEDAAATTPVILHDHDETGPQSSIITQSRMNEKSEQTEQRLEKMRGAVRTLLECIGEDPDREGLQATPLRYAKALLFLTEGYQSDITTVLNGALFSHEGHASEMVIVKDIEIYSLCEHHLVPFMGKIHIAYLPHKTLIGLSKLPRIAEMFARRLQIQERLTRQIAHAIMDHILPRGVMVVMESSHLCMEMRGVEKSGSRTVTSFALGCFQQEQLGGGIGRAELRGEFWRGVGLGK
ncbi:GTP cyclohydrolase I [Sphaerulina musiva SO2202]|uniref:GTP cyclohydrolase 1 n=1 Tax=Sphaerulina musiva (strain SO2202) TaxID=692275 RepID=M3DBF2_SPHMS|nr:GTP cyclohydrolase I [Sphaerulina musiva SO2202]EMF15184.1 GTP cyclohydrolase I [Sphaerulina musiva SO2202]